MTKKDYILIAGAIKEAKDSFVDSKETEITIKKVIFTLANALSKQNPLFDFDKFAFACGIESQI